MTYFEGFIVPVPAAKKDDYRTHASKFAPLVQEIGVRRMVEGWDSDVQAVARALGPFIGAQ